MALDQLRMAALCRRLGIPNPTIRELLTLPTVQWRMALERQIRQLEKQRRRTEAQLDETKWLLAHLVEPECVETTLRRYNEAEI